MTLPDLIRLAFTALVRHPLRAGLTLLGISVGIGSVALLTSLGESARVYIEAQFAFLGSDILVILPGRTETTGAMPGIGGAPNDLTLDDALHLERTLGNVRVAVPVVLGTETVSNGERARQCTVMSTVTEMQELLELDLVSGSFLPEGDMERGAPVVVLGRKIARELFPDVHPVGENIRIGDWRMRVIGITETRGTHLGIDMDELVMIPVATGLRMFNRTSLSRIMARLTSGTDAAVAEADILALMTDRHDELDVTVVTPGAILGTVGGILDALAAALAGIAAISLIVAGIGIMNVMLVSVSERTAEVGLYLAVGAVRRQVLAIFLTEAVLLSLAGGLLGLGGGMAIIRLVGRLYPEFPAATPAWVTGASLTLALVVGVGFGVLPARGATRLDPVTALSGN